VRMALDTAKSILKAESLAASDRFDSRSPPQRSGAY
jgi:hypothetical protein